MKVLANPVECAPGLPPRGGMEKAGGAHRCKTIKEPLPGVGERVAAPEKARAPKHFSDRSVEKADCQLRGAVIELVNDAFMQTRRLAGTSQHSPCRALLHLSGGIIGLALRIGYNVLGLVSVLRDQPAPASPPLWRSTYPAKHCIGRVPLRVCRSCMRSRSL